MNQIALSISNHLNKLFMGDLNRYHLLWYSIRYLRTRYIAGTDYAIEVIKLLNEIFFRGLYLLKKPGDLIYFPHQTSLSLLIIDFGFPNSLMKIKY